MNADRAPQLKASVRRSFISEEMSFGTDEAYIKFFELDHIDLLPCLRDDATGVRLGGTETKQRLASVYPT